MHTDNADNETNSNVNSSSYSKLLVNDMKHMTNELIENLYNVHSVSFFLFIFLSSIFIELVVCARVRTRAHTIDQPNEFNMQFACAERSNGKIKQQQRRREKKNVENIWKAHSKHY